jgi:hypothetical protein
MKFLASILALIVPFAPASPEAPDAAPKRGTSLCAPREAVIFECSTGRKKVAICAGDGLGAQYRAGLPGKLELTSPRRSAGLSYANRPYSGGGESQVKFTSGAYSYVLYSGIFRTSFDGPNNPEFISGVLVHKDGVQISNRKCVAPYDAAVDLTLAAKHLPEGDFVDHD